MKENTETKSADPIALKIEKNLLDSRKIFLWGEVNDESAKHIIERLFFLNETDDQKEITILINSPGGANTSGMAILDAMDAIRSPVSTLCMGLAASFGALILAHGKKGRRFAYPRSRIMIHQPHLMGQFTAPAADLGIFARHIEKDRREINRILATATGKTETEIENDTDRDFWFSAQEALDYGLIDAVATDKILNPSVR
ncbi:MAG TPA: ATP-dependent Clp protease proteolytic subunit [Leptospiraceae bacterium]|nr:ATP-dependent Clp protease proteolytic subunit [Leptospiraceae bacterium]